MAAKRLVQYVAIRKDLSSSLNWPGGAVIAQACHACTAAIVLYQDDPNTVEYVKAVDTMHKVIVECFDLRNAKGSVLKDRNKHSLIALIEVPDEEMLKHLSQKLGQHNISHKLWIEQPENFPTCLATRPYPKDDISKFFKALKLYQ